MTITPTAISDAVTQVKQAMLECSTAADALAEAAADFGLRPELLERKFAEATGTHPEAWLQGELQRQVAVALGAAAREAKALEDCMAFTNLAPLWERENQAKGHRACPALVVCYRLAWGLSAERPYYE